MVNFLHNITALAELSPDHRRRFGEDEIAVLGAPVVAGAANQDWMIIPQATANTFTLQSVAQPAVFVSYAAAARKVPGHSQAVVSDAFPTIFKMVAVAGGPAVNLIDTATNTALTTWANADPATFTFQGTPLTMEGLNAPKSIMQSFTIALCRYFSALSLSSNTELKYSELNACVSRPSEMRTWLVNVLGLHWVIYTVMACSESSEEFTSWMDGIKGYRMTSENAPRSSQMKRSGRYSEVETPWKKDSEGLCSPGNTDIISPARPPNNTGYLGRNSYEFLPNTPVNFGCLKGFLQCPWHRAPELVQAASWVGALLTFRLKRKHPIWLFDGGKAAHV
ncbi:hypothetical protein B0H13DRAFT_1893451 [Mycena leptocephala]|nr:hypothetical protein B0H13DRAFT_1893451 [Mycena leptocephala]